MKCTRLKIHVTMNTNWACTGKTVENSAEEEHRWQEGSGDKANAQIVNNPVMVMESIECSKQVAT